VIWRTRRKPLARRRANRFTTHIAIQEADETGSPVTWGQHVTDEQYNPTPPS
jgi:hypothetical protein